MAKNRLNLGNLMAILAIPFHFDIPFWLQFDIMCLKPLIHTKIFKRISSHLLDFGFWIAFTNFFRNFFFKNFHFPKKLSHKNAIKTDWLFWLFFLAKFAIFHLRQLATLVKMELELIIRLNIGLPEHYGPTWNGDMQSKDIQWDSKLCSNIFREIICE